MDSGPPSYAMEALARHVFAVDPKLAAEIAESAGTTLAALGLGVAPPPPPPVLAPPAPRALPASVVDSVVCAAAEAMDRMPREVRPALMAAFARARELELSVEQVLEALGKRTGGG